ncbi:MAG: peptide transporter [Thermoprotei archaeon]|nr:MAG: peptide transporter [Thermoprotei archaeon]
MLKGISRTVAALAVVVVIVVAVLLAVYLFPASGPTETTPTSSPSPSPSQSPSLSPSPSSSPSPSPSSSPSPSQSPSPAPTKTLHTQVLYIISDDEMTRIQMYKAGVADIAVVTPARWKDVNGTPVDGHQLMLIIRKDKPRLTIQHVILNTMKEPFNIPEVRRALAYAVPYDTIIEQIFGGLYTRLYTIVPKGMPGWTDYNIIHYDFNLSKAQEIIDELKETRGFDPSQYTIAVIYNTGNTARAQIAALLQNYWSRLGFKVVVETYSWPEFLRKVDHFDFDVALLGWIPDYLDPDNYLMPFVWGGAEFTELKYYEDVAPGDVGNYLASVDTWIDTEKYTVVVGPKGTGASYTGPTDKPLLVVSYVLDEEATQKNWEEPVSMVTIGAPGLKDVPLSALVKISRTILDPEAREAIVNAAVIYFNHQCPMIMLSQQVTGENHGSWVKDVYYPLTTFMRYDLVWETPDAPVRDTGVLGIKNDPSTMVIATIGWPDTLDPAKTYESFGWEVLWHIYSTLVTYWKEETEPLPELAAAWAFSPDATELYFVIRGGVVAYDPWNDKTYPIDATDVLFSVWRVARLNLPGSAVWMITDFIDVNASTVLSEEEFDQIAGQGLTTVYKGESKTVKSLSELLEFFGYTGETAGVVKFKLYFPYPPILHVFATAVTAVIPMEYALGDSYEEALAASNNGRNPSAWAQFVQPGEDDPTFKLLSWKPVSTGPYYVADFQEGGYILLRINPHYWNASLWEELYGYRP